MDVDVVSYVEHIHAHVERAWLGIEGGPFFKTITNKLQYRSYSLSITTIHG